MGGFALGNLLAALAPDYAGLSAARLYWHCPHPPSCRRPLDIIGQAHRMNAGTQVHALLRLLDEHQQEENIWKGFAATVRSKNRPNGETHNG